MVNLLPQSVQRSLARRYYINFATALLFALAAGLFIGGALLVPSYFAAKTSATSYERYRDALEGSVGLKERERVNDAVAILRERVGIMDTYAHSAFTAELVDAIGEKVTSKIAVTGISFTRSENGATVAIRGRASTRQDLLNFVESLKESPSFTEATLPVSQLVAEKNVDFAIQALFEKQSP